MKLRLLSQADVRRALGMPRAIALMEDAFRALSSGTINAPMRTNLSNKIGTLLYKPVLWKDAGAFGMKAVWVAAPAASQVVRINAYTNLIEKTVAAGQSPRAIAVGDGAVWVLSEGDGTVVRLDPATNRTAATIDVGRASAGGWIAVGEGSVWISARGAPLVRIDPRTNRVAQRFAGEAGGPLAVGHRSLWIAVSDAAVWRVDPRFVAALR